MGRPGEAGPGPAPVLLGREPDPATRPLIAAMTTLRTDLSRGERGMVGWKAPRGIVAASSAATFSAALVSAHLDGAQKILPATFIVIVVAVVLCGLTAVPVARLLRVVRRAGSSP